MEKILTFNFPQLSVEDKVLLRRILRAQRAQTLNDTLEKAKSPEVSERLGERVREVHRFLGEMVFLSKNNPDLFWQILDHWSAQFLLSRLLLDPEGPDDPDHLDQLVSNLSAILLFERLMSSTPTNTSATYITHTDEHGRVHGLLHGVSLEFQNEKFRKQVVEWVCSADDVTVLLSGQDEPEFTLQLPLQDNSFVKFIPLTSLESIRFPIINEVAVYGKPMTRFIGAYKNADHGETEWTPLTLKDSLTQAQATLQDLWPEALEWAGTLVPAFVDMGIPPTRIRFSSSYEPGSPIFMSRVDNHLTHAEDVVHEIQHHRLFLFAGPPHFKSWRDLRQFYISPYRPDPRPLRGLIIGMHAFLTVNELKKRRMVGHSEPLTREMAEIHYKNLFAFRSIIEHEEFGDLGKELCKQMAHTVAEHHSIVSSTISSEMEKSIEDSIRRHIAMVQTEASELRNVTPIYFNWNETAQLAASFS